MNDMDVQNRYLFFICGEDMYAIKALIVSEIIEYSSITKVPKMSPFVKGVTNIRGNIIPVIDLLERVGLGTTRINDRTSIIVVNHIEDDEKMQIGIIIDEVYEVDNIFPENIQKTPEFGPKIDTRFILQMGKYGDKYVEILDTQSLLKLDELSKVYE